MWQYLNKWPKHSMQYIRIGMNAIISQRSKIAPPERAAIDKSTSMTEKKYGRTGIFWGSIVSSLYGLHKLKENKVNALAYAAEDSQPSPGLVVKNLVFRGGGPKGIGYVGALLVLEEKLGGLQAIERVAGASAGAIMATLLAVGYTPQEIEKLLSKTPLSQFIQDGTELDELTTKLATSVTHYSHVRKFTSVIGDLVAHPDLAYRLIQRFSEKRGICSGEKFREWMDDTIASKIAELETGDAKRKKEFKHLTFGELAQYIKTHKTRGNTSPYHHLYIIGALLGVNNVEEVECPVFSTEDNSMQHYIISDAVRLSMSIPGMFDPHSIHIKKDNQRFELESDKKGIDGGVLDNYPIRLFDKNYYLFEPFAQQSPNSGVVNFETLGLTLYDKRVTEPLWRWFLKILKIHQNPTWKEDHPVKRDIKIDIRGASLLDFNMADEKVAELIESGKRHAEGYFHTEASKLREHQEKENERRQGENRELMAKYEKHTNLSNNRPVPYYQVHPKYQEITSHGKNLGLIGVVGISGSGKSELARYSAQQYLQTHFWRSWRNQSFNKTSPIVWFIEAETEESLLRSFKDLAKNLGSPVDEQTLASYGSSAREKTQGLYRYIQRELQHYPGCFFIFDNVEKQAFIKDYLTIEKNQIVFVTTQDESIKNNGDYNKKVIDLNMGLDFDTARKLVETVCPRLKERDLKPLLTELEGLPLALTIAAYYMKENEEITVTDYLKSWNEQYHELEKDQQNLAQERHSFARKPFTQDAAIRLSIEKLKEKHANELLMLCSSMHADGIPLALLKDYVEQLEGIQADSQKFLNSALKELRSYSLVRMHSNVLSTHRFVQETTRHRQTLSLSFLSEIINLFNNQLKDKNKVDPLIPHVLHFLELFDFQNLPKKSQWELARLFSEVGYHQFYKGNYISSKEFFEKSLAILERHYSPDHIKVAHILTNLANPIGALGDIAKKKELLERALAILEQHYDSEHIALANALSNLAGAIGLLGDMVKAKALLERALAIKERHHGPECIEIASTIHNLATAVGHLGDKTKEKELLERALAIKERHHGPDHIVIANTLNSLATALGGLGDRAKEKELLERALTIKERHYGPNHVEVANTLCNLADSVGALGDTGKKEELLERALAICKSYYGSRHVEVTGTLNRLATAVGNLGDRVKEKELLEQALEIKERYYGSNHLEISTALFNLATVVENLGDWTKAKELLERALAIKEHHYGPDHIELANTLNNLAITIRHLGDKNKQKELLERTLAIKEHHYSPNHIELANTLNNLAIVIGDLGDRIKQKELSERALTIIERHYDPDHVEVANILDTLAIAIGALGDKNKQKELSERALAIKEHHYGPDHIAVANILNTLAMAVGDLGDMAKKKELLEKALIIKERYYGPNHVEVADTLYKLALFSFELKFNEMLTLQYATRAYLIFRQNLGEEHEDTSKAQMLKQKCSEGPLVSCPLEANIFSFGYFIQFIGNKNRKNFSSDSKDRSFRTEGDGRRVISY